MIQKIRMGRKSPKPRIGFTSDHVLDRDLVIKMLRYEDANIKSEYGQSRYKDPLNLPYVSLTNEKAFNRMTLDAFGFTTEDEDVENFRTIFRTYYNSPTDYDKDVIDSIHYMKNNKLMFYEKPIIKIGDSIPNVPLYHLDGERQTTLYDAIREENARYTVFAAFSKS